MRAIHLLPVGDVKHELMVDLKNRLQITFHADALILASGFDARQFYDEQRGQYNSTSIIRHVKETTGGHGGKRSKAYLAVTSHDLFIPILTYVFGEAELAGGVAVASFYRLQNELYGLQPDKQLLIDRLCKEAIHELGHAFGLVHCQTQECVMHTSTYVEDIDLKSDTFCRACSTLLKNYR
ncbi:MAG: archaemetzincin family Zn-dependent metalloprotease [Bacteroidetes bacterium]|nr:archaemetzincin family Zn-dependent metalloprotease [Bacteroidota bacterium]MCW5896008.1 archaemetzincin family Zn-dependent metalloprotease [Bacteroidota bacterium]